MWQFGLRQIGRFVQGLLGAVLLAACVSALAENGASRSAGRFAAALFARLVALSHLDFGTSAVTAVPAWVELLKALPATFELIGLGALIALVVGIPAGLALSERRAMRLAGPFVKLLSALPVFCAALAILWLARRVLHWTSPSHAESLVTLFARGNIGAIESGLRAAALPALTVGLAGAYAVQNMLRSAISRASGEPYRKGLRALGLGRFEIDRLYMLPHVLGSFFSRSGEVCLSLTAATAVCEWVFDWPGAASLFLKSVALRDWAVVGLVLFVFAALTTVAEFAGALLARFFAGAEVVP